MEAFLPKTVSFIYEDPSKTLNKWLVKLKIFFQANTPTGFGHTNGIPRYWDIFMSLVVFHSPPKSTSVFIKLICDRFWHPNCRHNIGWDWVNNWSDEGCPAYLRNEFVFPTLQFVLYFFLNFFKNHFLFCS